MPVNNANNPILPEYGFVRQDVVRQVLGGISKGALYEAVRSGIFPEPIRITAKTVAWDVDEVRDFIERRKAEAKAKRQARLEAMSKKSHCDGQNSFSPRP